ncbi:ABC transporter permease [Mariprofundus erugo]|uniref:ABC transporter permease n=1 Tax=Mariprofundus erugo TaxID=2528639 RepID=UPI0010FEB7BB|nr:ABC transporter permease [Mariprofundus erugo]TLS73971.1 ABC transporter permease [Mariprofundus erugo]
MDHLMVYPVLGWRNLWLHPMRTLLTTAALAVGIAALTFLSAMDDGWLQQIKTNFALTVTGHIQIHAEGFEDSQKLALNMKDPDRIMTDISNMAAVQEVTRRIRVSGLASSAGANAGALVYGVEPVAEQQMSRLATFISSGSWLPEGDVRAAVLGDGLANKLNIGIGDKLVLMAAVPGGDIASEVFRVRGLVHSGVMEVDDLIVIVPLGMAQKWLGMGNAVTDIVIRATSFDAVTPLAERLRERLHDRHLEVLRWIDIDPMAEQWADFADAYTWIVLAVVIVVVLAEVLNTMLMSMHERMHEFGLMGALGVTSRQMFAMMVWETMLLVLIGGAAGFLLGGGLALWYGEQGIDLSRFAIAFSFMYMDPVIHPLLRPESVFRILGAALFGAMIAGLIPAWKASRLEPVMALRE